MEVGESSVLKAKKWLTMCAAFFMMWPVGVPYYWGNMAVYVLSYIAFRGQSDVGIDTPWIISIYLVTMFCGIYAVGQVNVYHKINARLFLLGGAVLFNGGLFVTSWTVQISVAMVTLSVAVMSGIGAGVIIGSGLQCTLGWAGEDVGLISSLVMSGYSAGPVFINFFVTQYVNPDNFFPDTAIATTKLFSQTEVLDRVPSLFRTLGTMSLLLQAVAIAGIRIKPATRDEELQVPTTEPVSRPTGYNDTGNGSLFEPQDGTGDLGPSEIIKTKLFYSLLIMFTLVDSSLLILTNYYKDYGAVWISDDHFLSFLGGIFTVSVILGTPFWGMLSDYFGIKKTLIVTFSVLQILFFLVYFTPMVSGWLYMVNVVVIGFSLPPGFAVLTACVCRVFGKTHFTLNFSYVNILNIAFCFVNPILFQKVKAMGWFYIFCLGGNMCALCLILILVTLPLI